MRQLTIIGAGALGSHLALLLRNIDAKTIVIDFDRVERKNTLSQFHTRMTLGQNKAQALARSLHGLFGRRLNAVPHRLTQDNAEALIGGSALVLDCLDNALSRATVQRTVRDLGAPCIHGGLAADGQFGRAVWDEDFIIDSEPAEAAATCEDGEHLPFIALVAATMAHSAQSFLDAGRRQSFHILPNGAVEPL